MEGLKQSKLAINKDLGAVEQHAIKNEEKIEKLQTFDLIFIFLAENCLVILVFKICLFINQHLVHWM